MQKKCRFRKILRKVEWFYALMMLLGISRLLEKTRIGTSLPLSLRPMLTSNLLKRRQNRYISADFTIETCSNGLFLLSLQQFWTIMQTKKDGDNNDWEGKGEAIS